MARNGWAIGSEAEYPNHEAQDAADAQSIYETLGKTDHSTLL